MEPLSLGGGRKKSSESREVRDLAAVLSSFGVDFPSGSGYCKMRCFVHGERRPSATVNLDTDFFSCFSCGFRGDSIAIIMNQKSCSFKEALVYYHEVTGTPMDQKQNRSHAPSGAAEAQSYESSWLASQLKGKR